MKEFDIGDLTREERELVIRTSELDHSFDVFTTSPIWKARLERLGWGLTRDRQGGWSCRIPENGVTIRREKAVNLSPEERAKRAANLPRRPNSGGRASDQQ